VDNSAAALEQPAPQEASATGLMHDIVVIGASAGGVPTLQRLVGALPEDLRAALFVVLHLSAEARSELPAILGRAGPLRAVAAADGMPIEHGRIHVAPPDHHLLVEPERIVVTRGPRENRHRPAIDPLFRSAAWAYGPRVVGLVLSGTLDDGTAGLWAIKSCGGTTVVQEPGDALHPEMPQNALTHNRVDHRLPLDEMAPLLTRLAHEPVAAKPTRAPDSIHDELEFARMRRGLHDQPPRGTLTPFTCPSCHGALWELDEGGHLRYRCHTGHAFSHSSLLVEQGTQVEESIYTALRAVEEKSLALRRLAARWPERFPVVKAEYETRARELDTASGVLRRLLGQEVG
jgi:two-component system chemotaxis response regulator CheB